MEAISWIGLVVLVLGIASLLIPIARRDKKSCRAERICRCKPLFFHGRQGFTFSDVPTVR